MLCSERGTWGKFRCQYPEGDGEDMLNVLGSGVQYSLRAASTTTPTSHLDSLLHPHQARGGLGQPWDPRGTGHKRCLYPKPVLVPKQRKQRSKIPWVEVSCFKCRRGGPGQKREPREHAPVA